MNFISASRHNSSSHESQRSRSHCLFDFSCCDQWIHSTARSECVTVRCSGAVRVDRRRAQNRQTQQENQDDAGSHLSVHRIGESGERHQTKGEKASKL
jgi:hypothetical protein